MHQACTGIHPTVIFHPPESGRRPPQLATLLLWRVFRKLACSMPTPGPYPQACLPPAPSAPFWQPLQHIPGLILRGRTIGVFYRPFPFCGFFPFKKKRPTLNIVRYNWLSGEDETFSRENETKIAVCQPLVILKARLQKAKKLVRRKDQNINGRGPST